MTSCLLWTVTFVSRRLQTTAEGRTTLLTPESRFDQISRNSAVMPSRFF